LKSAIKSKVIWINSLMLAITGGLAAYETYIPFLQSVLPGDATIWILTLFAVNNIINIILRFLTKESLK